MDAEAFVRTRLRIDPVPAVPEISLYQAHGGSRLHHHAERAGLDATVPPYWAFAWGGGLALARYLLDHPQVVAGRRVLDLGAGSGLVAIAAAKAGASKVLASEIDPVGQAAIRLNAQLNRVTVEVRRDDLLDGPAPGVGIVLVGDLFYEAVLAARVTTFLDLCHAGRITVLVGDPGRSNLPLQRIAPLQSFSVGDFASPAQEAVVYGWLGSGAPQTPASAADPF